MVSHSFDFRLSHFLKIGKKSVFLFSAVLLLFCGQSVFAQNEIKPEKDSSINSQKILNEADKASLKAAPDSEPLSETDNLSPVNQPQISGNQTPESGDASKISFAKFAEKDYPAIPVSQDATAITPFKSDDNDSDKNKKANSPSEGFQWRPAIEQSLLFLAVQHGYALTQPKTRRALKGKFFKDYVDSVKSLRGWGDGGRFFTNYIAHPMQGSFMGFIQIQNDPKGKRQRFGGSKDYWQSRLKAMAWSAAWSTQFEIGPISQASIGNVGLSGKQTYVDIVVTPTVGTAMLIAEDAVDRFLIEGIERKTDNYYLMAFSRMLLNPTRTMANIIRFKLPWYRDRPRRR